MYPQCPQQHCVEGDDKDNDFDFLLPQSLPLWLVSNNALINLRLLRTIEPHQSIPQHVDSVAACHWLCRKPEECWQDMFRNEVVTDPSLMPAN